jgi:hypothetical protein
METAMQWGEKNKGIEAGMPVGWRAARGLFEMHLRKPPIHILLVKS